MTYVYAVLAVILNVFRYHKLKILFLLFSFVVCFFLLFPKNDLADFAGAQISAVTRNQVNAQFDEIGFGLLPQLGLVLSKVSLDAAFGNVTLANLRVGSVGVAPNILQYIINNIKGTIKLADAIAMISKIRATDIFGGNLTVHIAGSSELGPQTPAIRVEVDASDIDIKNISSYLKDSFKSQFTGSGTAALTTNIVLDPVLKEQPQGKYEMTINQLVIPAAPVTFPFNGIPMSVNLPGLKLANLKLRGKIDDRRFIVEEGKLGSPKDDLYGDVTGDVVINLRPGGMIDPGAYNFVVNLNLKQAMIDQLGAMGAIVDGFVAKHKISTADGVRYNFRIKGTQLGPGASPNISSP